MAHHAGQQRPLRVWGLSRHRSWFRNWDKEAVHEMRSDLPSACPHAVAGSYKIGDRVDARTRVDIWDPDLAEVVSVAGCWQLQQLSGKHVGGVDPCARLSWRTAPLWRLRIRTKMRERAQEMVAGVTSQDLALSVTHRCAAGLSMARLSPAAASASTIRCHRVAVSVGRVAVSRSDPSQSIRN
jgi:hypothetical protein